MGSRFPVKLSKKDVLEPDIIFIPKEKTHLIRERYFDGAPDLVIEILSDNLLPLYSCRGFRCYIIDYA